MNKIGPTETLLTGRWNSHWERGTAEATSRRIQHLVAEHLVLLGGDASGWNGLYRDPDDGRLWELTYPDSYIHGGGAPEPSGPAEAGHHSRLARLKPDTTAVRSG
jgi:Immunity protein 27